MTLCNRRPSRYLSDDVNGARSSSLADGRPYGSASGPTSLGDVPSPGLESLASASPFVRFAPSPTRSAPTTRDSARPRGFKQGDGQAAEPAMPANHPHDLHHPGRPRIGSCSGPAFFGAHPTTSNAPATADRALSVIAPTHTGNGAPA